MWCLHRSYDTQNIWRISAPLLGLYLDQDFIRSDRIIQQTRVQKLLLSWAHNKAFSTGILRQYERTIWSQFHVDAPKYPQISHRIFVRKNVRQIRNDLGRPSRLTSLPFVIVFDVRLADAGIISPPESSSLSCSRSAMSCSWHTLDLETWIKARNVCQWSMEKGIVAVWKVLRHNMDWGS